MKKSLIVLILFILAFSFISSKSKIIASKKTDGDRVFYSVLFHSPGERWVDSLSFRDQPGIEEHVNYMGLLLKNKKLVLGGPFLDNSGGMVIFDGTIEEAEKAANDDPAVKNCLLKVKVKPWMVVMSRQDADK